MTTWIAITEGARYRGYQGGRTGNLDDLLTAVAARRDGAAFTALFDHFRPRVHAQMLRLGLAPFAAADVTQDVMETVWSKAHLFDRRKSGAATWIFSIAQNRRIDAARRSREHTGTDEELFAILDPADSSEASLDAAQRQKHVHAALDALPHEQFRMVQLAFFEGLSHSSIAEQTKIPVGTVKSRLRLAFCRLRRLLQDAGITGAC